MTEYAKVEEMAQICMHMYTSKPFTFAIDSQDMKKQGFPFAQPYLSHVPALVVGAGDHQRIPAVDCFAFLMPQFIPHISIDLSK